MTLKLKKWDVTEHMDVYYAKLVQSFRKTMCMSYVNVKRSVRYECE